MAIRKLLESAEFREQLANDDKGILFDVRMREEYDEDRICESIHCDYMQIEDFTNTLKHMDKDKHYYVYCMTGRRSAEACDLMEELGFEYLVDLKGGVLHYDGKLCS